MTRMTKEQLKGSIEKITQAIQLVSTTEGYYYDKAHETTNLMLEQKRRMERELHSLEYGDKVNERIRKKLERHHKVLGEWIEDLNNWGELTEQKHNEILNQMAEIRERLETL